jgi:hypothetical protein
MTTTLLGPNRWKTAKQGYQGPTQPVASTRPASACLRRNLRDDAMCTTTRSHASTSLQARLGNPSQTCFDTKQAARSRRVSCADFPPSVLWRNRQTRSPTPATVLIAARHATPAACTPRDKQTRFSERNKYKRKTIPDSNSNLAKSMTHHNQTK